MWEKKKLLVTSNFFFSHNVFKSCLLLMRQNEYLWSKGIRTFGSHLKYSSKNVCRTYPQIKLSGKSSYSYDLNCKPLYLHSYSNYWTVTKCRCLINPFPNKPWPRAYKEMLSMNSCSAQNRTECLEFCSREF